jgi:hypothetical protein
MKKLLSGIEKIEKKIHTLSFNLLLTNDRRSQEYFFNLHL